MAGDALTSAGVVVAGLAILATGWNWLDPLVSLILSAIVVYGTWGLLRDSLMMSLAAVPSGIDPAAVRRFLEALPGVGHIHDLHIWPMSTTEVALTCHLFVPGGHPGDAFLVGVSEALRERFGIGHATMQVETDAATICALEPENRV